MSVLTAIQLASAAIGLDVPTLVYGSAEREHIELQMIAGEAAEVIWNASEWESLKSKATIAGLGTTGPYALPSNFGRLLDDGHIYSSLQPRKPLSHNVDTTEWLVAENNPSLISNPLWRVSGKELFILPALEQNANLTFYYVKKLTPLTGDSEEFQLSERLLKLAIIWMWKASKGQSYAEEMQSYELALAETIKIDQGPNALKTGLPNAIRVNDHFVTPAEYLP